MSNQQVDERVVEMRFDNQNFEKNVSTSMSTLEKLKAALKLDGAAKGFDSLSASTKSLANSGAISSIVNGIEQINSRYSILGKVVNNVKDEIAGSLTTILTQTTSTVASLSSLSQTAQEIVSAAGLISSSVVSMTDAANMSAGWEKFGEKTRAVQTIVSQGFDLDEVNKQMENLLWFTDETSYNFTDMVGEIGKFTATGQGLEESVTAMEGIALWAAASGQNASTASRAMYQLSQAMGVGSLRYQDYKSIQNANMDTKEFREQAILAAEALGVLKKSGEDAFQVLASGKEYSMAELFSSDALTRENWFNKDVMMTVFQRYSEAVDQIREYAEEHGITASEAIQKLGGSIDALALKWFKAGQEARTFQDTVDSVKDAVSTGWMRTFELIFGNAEEATTVWTWWANTLYDVFMATSEARNEMLQYWRDAGGGESLAYGISYAWNAVADVLGRVGEAWETVFPKTTGEKLVEMTNGFLDGAKSLYSWLVPDTDKANEMLGTMEDIQKVADKYYGGDFDQAALDMAVDAVKQWNTELDEIADKYYGGDLDAAARDVARQYIDSFKEQKAELDNVNNRAMNLRHTVTGFASALDIVKQALKAVNEVFVKPILQKVPGLLDSLLKKTGSIGLKITNFVNKLRSENFFVKKLTEIRDKLGGAIGKVQEFINKIKGLESVQKLLSTLSGFKDSVIDKIKSFFDLLGKTKIPLPTMDQLVGIIDLLATGLNNLISAVQTGGGAVIDFFKDLDLKSFFETPDVSLSDWIKKMFSGKVDFSPVREFAKQAAKNLVEGFTSAFSDASIMDFLKGVGRTAIIGKVLYNIVSFFDSLTKSMKGFADIPGAVVKLLGGAKDVLKAYTTELRTESLKNIAIAIVALAGAFWVLSKIDASAMNTAVVAIVLVSGAIAILMNALARLNEAKAARQGVENIKGFISVLQLFAKLVGTGIKEMLSKLGTAAIISSIGKALLSIAVGFGVIAAAIIALKQYGGSMSEIHEVASMLMDFMDPFILLIGFVATLSAGFSKYGVDINGVASTLKQFGKAFERIAMSLLIITASLLLLSKFSGDNLDHATKVLGGVGLAITMALATIGALSSGMFGFKINTGAMLTFAKSFQQISASLLIISAALILLSNMTDPAELANATKCLGIMAAVVAAMDALMVVLATAAKKQGTGASDISAMAKTFVTMAGSLAIIAAALALIANTNVSIGTVGITILALVGALGSLVIAGALIQKLNLAQALKVISTTLLAIGASVLIVGAGVYVFAAAIELLSRNSDTIPEVMQKMGEGIVAFGNAIKGNADAVAAFVLTMLVVAATAVAVGYAISQIVKGMTVVLEALEPFLQKIANSLPKMSTILIGGTALLIAGFLSWLSGEMGNVVSVIVQLIIIAIDSLAVAIVDNGYAIGQAIGNVINALMVLVIEGFWGIASKIPGLGPIVEKYLGPTLEELKNSASSDIQGDIDELSGEVDTGISGMIDGAKNKLTGGIDVSGIFTGDATGEASQAGGEAADAYTNEAVSKLNSATSTQDAIKEKFAARDVVVEAATESADAYTQTTAEELAGDESVSTGLQDMFTNEEAMSAAASTDATAFMTSMQDSIGTSSLDMNGILGDNFDIASWLESAISEMTGAGESIDEGLASGITGNSEVVKGAGSSLGESAMSGTTSTLGIASPSTVYAGYGENSVQGYANGINSAAPLARSAAANMASSAARSASSGTSGFYNAGWNAGKGFVDGLQSWIANAAGAGRKIAQAAYEAAMNTLDEASPSKLMRRIGSFAGEGFVIGLESWVDKSYSTSTQMARQVMEGLSDPLKRINDVLNADLDVNPVITPVLDLSEIQNGSRNLNSMLGNQTVTATGMYGITETTLTAQLMNGINSLRKDLGEMTNQGTEVNITINAAPGMDPDAIAAKVENRMRIALGRRSAIVV